MIHPIPFACIPVHAIAARSIRVLPVASAGRTYSSFHPSGRYRVAPHAGKKEAHSVSMMRRVFARQRLGQIAVVDVHKWLVCRVPTSVTRQRNTFDLTAA